MPVDFRFSSLSIQDFRGARELDITLPENMPLHFIGANNSGKSTVLEALALVFKSGGMHAFVSSEFDFFHDANGKDLRAYGIDLGTTTSTLCGVELPAGTRLGL